MAIYGRVFDLGRLIDLLCLTLLSVIFQLCHDNQFSGERSRNTRREQSTMGKQRGKLYQLRLRIECIIFVIYKVGHEPTPYF